LLWCQVIDDAEEGRAQFQTIAAFMIRRKAGAGKAFFGS